MTIASDYIFAKSAMRGCRKWDCLTPGAAQLEPVQANLQMSLACGDDGAQSTTWAVVLSDGVGSCAGSGAFARALVRNVFRDLTRHWQARSSDADVLATCRGAHAVTLKQLGHAPAKGGATLCFAALVAGQLRIGNLGDSGLVVLRDNHVMLRTSPGQHAFNTPFILTTTDSHDLDRRCTQLSMAVQEDDLVIVASDGLFDNLGGAEIQACVRKCTQRGGVLSTAAVAEALVSRAKAGIKPDDITVFVGRVGRAAAVR